MSLKYRNYQGNEVPISGLNGTSGELVPSVALQQSGTIAIPQTAASGTGTIPVTFATPMPDTDYTLNFEIMGNAWYNLTLQSNKTVNGFTVVYQNVDKTASSAMATVKWTAFKLMTDTVHEADSTHIVQNTANFAPAFSESVSYTVGDYCTYSNVLYRCTTNHTAGAWDSTHFTQVTVGGDLSEEPVLLGEWSILNTSVQTKNLNESVANFRFLMIEARTLGICRGSGYFRCHRDASYEYLFRYIYQSNGYVVASTIKSNLTQVDIEIPTLQPSTGVTVTILGIR